MKTIQLNKNNDHQYQFRRITIQINQQVMTIEGHSGLIFGMGERFDSIDLHNSEVENKVLEKFCHQGSNTYLPMPFFMLEEGLGIFIETERVFTAQFNEVIKIDLKNVEDNCRITLFEGEPEALIQAFIQATGETLLPPKWAFGPWLSGHRWNSEKLIQEQLSKSQELGFPFTTLVIEQWSDEATFYVFNQARYIASSTGLKYEDFSFDEDAKWPNPKKMVQTFKDQGIHTILWQVPVIKELEAHEPTNKQNALDHTNAIENEYIVKNEDLSPYRIPKGHWFPGSLIPDFTSSKAKEWWFSKHQYLLDIGIDGFKTDGGEFIYNPNSIFSNGKRGYDMINRYSALTIKSYHEFVGDQRVLFSRAGYIGQQSNTIHWAGDQKSEWSELQAVYRAGISASLSGQTFWSFDIGGFAGELPSPLLYLRATQFSVFTPIMQLHSEPVGGQFALLDASKVMKNDRTPWNMAEHFNDPSLLDQVRKYYGVRMNLLPTIYAWSIQAVRSKNTLMKHMWVAFPKDTKAHNHHEQYMFGSLLCAPILEEDVSEKTVYFPEGTWTHLLSGKVYPGNTSHSFNPSQETDFLVFVQTGSALFLNLNGLENLGHRMSNDVKTPSILNVWLYGAQGTGIFEDNEGNSFTITWENKNHQIIGQCKVKLNIKYI